MIYRGFNQREVAKISEILDRNGVQYTTGVPDEAMEHINDKSKRVNHKFMDNVLQFEIEATEFDKISPKDIQALFDLRIYREEESPFTEEELNNAGTETDHVTPKKTSKEESAIKKWATIFAAVAVVLFSLWRHGVFK